MLLIQDSSDPWDRATSRARQSASAISASVSFSFSVSLPGAVVVRMPVNLVGLLPYFEEPRMYVTVVAVPLVEPVSSVSEISSVRVTVRCLGVALTLSGAWFRPWAAVSADSGPPSGSLPDSWAALGSVLLILALSMETNSSMIKRFAVLSSWSEANTRRQVSTSTISASIISSGAGSSLSADFTVVLVPIILGDLYNQSLMKYVSVVLVSPLPVELSAASTVSLVKLIVLVLLVVPADHVYVTV